jgi:hypothetical protein
VRRLRRACVQTLLGDPTLARLARERIAADAVRGATPRLCIVISTVAVTEIHLRVPPICLRL